jgi:predicted nuclease of restriction endonuclease-like (RecB) superfamily
MNNELANHSGQFDEILQIIDDSRSRALKAVNAELIQMYWNVGASLSALCGNSSFGDKAIDEVAAYIAQKNPNIKGFTRRGLYRMKQFYETYKDDEFVSPLVTQISWTNHLLIMSGSKSQEERHFYMALCVKEHYSKRDLERQMDSAYYERYMLSSKKLAAEVVSGDVRKSILDTYVLEFLDLPEQYSEKNLRHAIIENLKQFILEFGKDFTFIGEEYHIQVGGQDFYIDLLFYNRALSCLVPIELKIGKFKPEHIGQINFYLEALDRDVKKPNENPSVGVILCAGKDDAVVEYALSRSMSPTLVSSYQLCLPDKKLLQNKLRELTELALESGGSDENDKD